MCIKTKVITNNGNESINTADLIKELRAKKVVQHEILLIKSIHMYGMESGYIVTDRTDRTASAYKPIIQNIHHRDIISEACNLGYDIVDEFPCLDYPDHAAYVSISKYEIRFRK